MPARPYPARSPRARDPSAAVDGRVSIGGLSGTGAAGGEADGGGLPARGRIAVRGFVERVTLAPALGSPSFEVLVRVDLHGTRQDIRVVWMGQRRVPGIEAGIGLRFEGMMTLVDGSPTVYNPRYEIIGRPEEY